MTGSGVQPLRLRHGASKVGDPSIGRGDLSLSLSLALSLSLSLSLPPLAKSGTLRNNRLLQATNTRRIDTTTLERSIAQKDLQSRLTRNLRLGFRVVVLREGLEFRVLCLGKV